MCHWVLHVVSLSLVHFGNKVELTTRYSGNAERASSPNTLSAASIEQFTIRDGC